VINIRNVHWRNIMRITTPPENSNSPFRLRTSNKEDMEMFDAINKYKYSKQEKEALKANKDWLESIKKLYERLQNHFPEEYKNIIPKWWYSMNKKGNFTLTVTIKHDISVMLKDFQSIHRTINHNHRLKTWLDTWIEKTIYFKEIYNVYAKTNNAIINLEVLTAISKEIHEILKADSVEGLHKNFPAIINYPDVCAYPDTDPFQLKSTDPLAAKISTILRKITREYVMAPIFIRSFARVCYLGGKNGRWSKFGEHPEKINKIEKNISNEYYGNYLYTLIAYKDPTIGELFIEKFFLERSFLLNSSQSSHSLIHINASLQLTDKLKLPKINIGQPKDCFKHKNPAKHVYSRKTTFALFNTISREGIGYCIIKDFIIEYRPFATKNMLKEISEKFWDNIDIKLALSGTTCSILEASCSDFIITNIHVHKMKQIHSLMRLAEAVQIKIGKPVFLRVEKDTTHGCKQYYIEGTTLKNIQVGNLGEHIKIIQNNDTYYFRINLTKATPLDLRSLNKPKIDLYFRSCQLEMYYPKEKFYEPTKISEKQFKQIMQWVHNSFTEKQDLNHTLKC